MKVSHFSSLFFLLSSKFLLNTLFSDAVIVCSSLNMRDLLHTHAKYNKILILNILGSRWGDQYFELSDIKHFFRVTCS